MARCLQGEAVQRCMNLMGCFEVSKHIIELHLLSDMFSDFPEKYQNWATIDPQDLFDAPILKKESN
ncbi:unnamed protein product, partial [Arabidopsis halleri]